MLAVGEQQARLGVGEHVGQLAAAVGEVERHRHRAEAQRREVGEHRLLAVAQPERDALACLDAARVQRRRPALRRRVQLVVRVSCGRRRAATPAPRDRVGARRRAGPRSSSAREPTMRNVIAHAERDRGGAGARARPPGACAPSARRSGRSTRWPRVNAPSSRATRRGCRRRSPPFAPRTASAAPSPRRRSACSAAWWRWTSAAPTTPTAAIAARCCCSTPSSPGGAPRPSRCGTTASSFPWLLVRVRRHASVSLRFRDADGCRASLGARATRPRRAAPARARPPRRRAGARPRRARGAGSRRGDRRAARSTPTAPVSRAGRLRDRRGVATASAGPRARRPARG